MAERHFWEAIAMRVLAVRPLYYVMVVAAVRIIRMAQRKFVKDVGRDNIFRLMLWRLYLER